jgi:group I intron endonuclease
MQHYGHIYVIKNAITGMQYVGQTTQDIYVRWRNHNSDHSRCPYLFSALKKYGRESFILTIVDYAENKEELDDAEIYWVRKLNTMAPNGYNVKEPGGTRGKLQQESKDKVAKSKRATLSRKEFKTSKYKGVGYSKQKGKFRCALWIGKKIVVELYFESEEVAAKVYDYFAFTNDSDSYLNFPNEVLSGYQVTEIINNEYKDKKIKPKILEKLIGEFF